MISALLPNYMYVNEFKWLENERTFSCFCLDFIPNKMMTKKTNKKKIVAAEKLCQNGSFMNAWGKDIKLHEEMNPACTKNWSISSLGKDLQFSDVLGTYKLI